MHFDTFSTSYVIFNVGLGAEMCDALTDLFVVCLIVSLGMYGLPNIV